jgi:3-deoxy-manno-octulosonate cytidylyltransferase (CMP-KDO synthetase)
MVLHVVEAARAAKRLDRILVATDDARIASAVRDAGAEALLTSPTARSGTDRLAEAARAVPADIYVNVQGDEPMMSPQNVDRCVETLLVSPERGIATLALPLSSDRATNPNVVKVAVAWDGRALYFSRAPIPYFREGEPDYRKHLGIYAYRSVVLRDIATLSPSPLERAESLEQLRWLEAGFDLWVGEAATDSIGVDTPEDLARAERLMRKEIAS